MVYSIKKNELNLKIDVKNAPAIVRAVKDRLILMRKRVMDVSRIQNIMVNPKYVETDLELEYSKTLEESPQKLKLNPKRACTSLSRAAREHEAVRVRYESVSPYNLINPGHSKLRTMFHLSLR